MAAILPSGFQDTVVIENLEEPTAFRFAPNGEVFVAEKQGKILAYEHLGDTTPTEFADLRTQVYDHGDRGLLGLALDPKFSEGRPYVYALYTYDHLLGDPEPAPKWGLPDHTGDECVKPEWANVDSCPVSGRLVRLTANGEHAVEEEGEPVEKTLVEDWCQQDSSHSIGTVEFGPEGALYAGGGDGASFIYADWGQANWPEPNFCGDPPEPAGTPLELPTAEGGSLRAQNPQNLDGSIIRVDPETGKGWPGNPLAASAVGEGTAAENERRIVAYGMRNPYRFTMQPGTGVVYVGNVGGSLYEEIDRFDPQSVQAYNSGWPCYEGPEKEYLFKKLEPLPEVCETLYREVEEGLEPVSRAFFDYSHKGGVTPSDECPRENGSAISGLRFYEGSAYPAAYHGALFFADTVRGCIYVMRVGANGELDPLTVEPFDTEDGPYPAIDVEEGPGEDLYYTSLFGPGYTNGAVHRISYVPGTPTARLSATPRWGEALPLEVHLDASASSDPEGEQLTYEWDLDESGEYKAGGAEETLILSEEKNRTITLRVKDQSGKTSFAQVTVYPGDTPPAVTIGSPDPQTLRWHVGQQIEFSGSGVELEGNGSNLPATSLYWHARLYHCPTDLEHCHAHPLQVFPGVKSGSFSAPDHDYPSYIELSLTGTDARGLTASTAIKLEPDVVEIPLTSEPPGVTLSAGLLSNPAPFVLKAIRGSQVQLAAPRGAQIGGAEYRWMSWSDGGEPTHTVVAGDLEPGEGYLATYEPIPTAPGGREPETRAINTLPGARHITLRHHPPRRTHSRLARFAFTSSVAGTRFACKLDRRRFESCKSPRVYRHLKRGAHVFKVAALDDRGAIELPRVVYRWKVL